MQYAQYLWFWDGFIDLFSGNEFCMRREQLCLQPIMLFMRGYCSQNQNGIPTAYYSSKSPKPSRSLAFQVVYSYTSHLLSP